MKWRYIEWHAHLSRLKFFLLCSLTMTDTKKKQNKYRLFLKYSRIIENIVKIPNQYNYGWIIMYTTRIDLLTNEWWKNWPKIIADFSLRLSDVNISTKNLLSLIQILLLYIYIWKIIINWQVSPDISRLISFSTEL